MSEKGLQGFRSSRSLEESEVDIRNKEEEEEEEEEEVGVMSNARAKIFRAGKWVERRAHGLKIRSGVEKRGTKLTGNLE